jgi:hypothetical protein
MGVPRLTTTRLASVLLGAAFSLASCADAGGPSHPGRVVSSVPAALRPTPGSGEDPPTFDIGDDIEHYDSRGGFFRVHFTRKGRHAVPSADDDRDGTPDYVQTVGKDYDEVLAFYRELGYREPLRDGDVPGEHGGDDRFDVYLLDFPTSADGQFEHDDPCAANGCSGFMRLENDFNGRPYASNEAAIRLVASHEFFHAVQYAYTARATTLLAEGTAVWASEAFDAETGDLERQVPGYLNSPDRTLDQNTAGTFDSFSYGSSLFFEYVDEHSGRDVLRELWEKVAAKADESMLEWPGLLDDVLRNHDSSIASVFSSFAIANLYTGSRADPEHGYKDADSFPLVHEEMVTRPDREQIVRVFPLAAHYYSVRVDADLKLGAAADLDDDPGSPGVELAVAVEHEHAITQLERAPLEPGREVYIEAARGDTLHVVVLNTQRDGQSLRPNLCIGSEAEVATCRGGHGAPDAGPTASQAGAPAMADMPAQQTNQGGCSVVRTVGGRTRQPLAAGCVMLSLLGWRLARARSRGLLTAGLYRPAAARGRQR